MMQQGTGAAEPLRSPAIALPPRGARKGMLAWDGT